jgi:uncharacterized protein (TIGR03435 family)
MMMGAIACVTLAAQPGVQNPPVLMPPVPPSMPPPPPSPLVAPQGVAPDAAKLAEAKRLAANISAYASTKCGGKDSAAEPDCWMKSLWDATQCPPEDASAKKDALSNKDLPANKDAAPSQPCVPGSPGFVYDVASIKPHKSDGTGNSMVNTAPDGYRAVSVTMQNTVLNAFYTGLQLQITGGPSWFNELRYDIEAKFVPEVADALKKLSQDDRSFVQRTMMQQVLKERTNLVAHMDTKEVPAYDLVVGKNGPKFKASDPNAKDNGRMMIQSNQGKTVLTAKGTAMASFARNLSNPAGRPVFDKTGLTGTYDVTLEYAQERLNATPVTGGDGAANVPAAPEPSGPSIMAALEEQLGLKLVSSRGPMQVVVIEHMDKPDVN